MAEGRAGGRVGGMTEGMAGGRAEETAVGRECGSQGRTSQERAGRRDPPLDPGVAGLEAKYKMIKSKKKEATIKTKTKTSKIFSKKL